MTALAALKFRMASKKWGDHPASWPRPPREMPRWWQFRVKRRLRGLESVFGPIDAAALDRYWQEVRKGQSIYEDAGGAMLRCYAAMIGERVDWPYPYFPEG